MCAQPIVNACLYFSSIFFSSRADMVKIRSLMSLKIEIDILRLADVAAFDVSGNFNFSFASRAAIKTRS